MDRLGRIAFFRADGGPDEEAEDCCRGCGAPAPEAAGQDAPSPACRHCGYPEKAAAFVDYDGCC